LHLTRLPIRVRDGAVHPEFLGEPDAGWLEALLVAAAGCVGARWRELEAAMRRPVAEGVSARRQGLAAFVVGRLYRRRVQAVLPPPDVRALVFGLATAGGSRAAIIARAAEELETDGSSIEQALFADLPSERVVVAPATLPSADELAVRANLEMCRSLLMRATEVEIDLVGDPHALVRRAQRGGLIWSLVAVDGDRACLRLSGPLRLFRRTTRYGHALGELLPELADCRRFDLFATLALGDREVELRLRSSDPFLPPGSATRLARRTRFRKLLEAGEWMVRDAQPIAAGPRLLFPDIELTRAGDQDRRWLLEWVGFWTPQYLEEKCAAYAAAGVERLILCVDERMQCGEGDAPSGVRIAWHRGSVSPEQIWLAVNSAQ
jgi:uncharacterized protein